MFFRSARAQYVAIHLIQNMLFVLLLIDWEQELAPYLMIKVSRSTRFLIRTNNLVSR